MPARSVRCVNCILVAVYGLAIASTVAKGQDGVATGTATDLNRLRTVDEDGLTSLDLGGARVSDKELSTVAAMEDLDRLILWDTQVTDDGLEHLKSLKCLKVLGLSRQPITDRGLRHLEHLDQLRELHLWDTKITDAGLERLKGLVNLEILWVGSTQITDSGLANLSGLTKLKKLILGETSISDEGLAHLENLTQLEELGLWKTKVAGNGLKHLATLERLQILALGYTQVADADLAHLRRLNQLRDLNLANTRMTDAGMEVLGGFDELQTLHLSHNAITDAGLVHLSRLTKLENLILDFTKIRGDGLTHLRAMSSLRQLSLWNTLLTDDALLHIEPLTSLERLNVANTQITDAGLDRIQNLVQLRELYLSGTRVTDAGLPRLSKMTDLEQLGLLRLTGVTDDGLVHLEGLKKLRLISLAGTRVTPAGIATLRRSFPTAIIKTGPPARTSPRPQQTVSPVRSSLLPGSVPTHGRPSTPRAARSGPQRIALPDESDREYAEVIVETLKVKIGDEVIDTVQRGDRLPVLRRQGSWIGILLSNADGDRLGWVLGSGVRSIVPPEIDPKIAPTEIPETVAVRIDHTQFGGSTPTKICFMLSLTNSSSQAMPFDASAVQLLVGGEALVAVKRDEPQYVPSALEPRPRPLSISVPEKEDQRPARRGWNDLPHWNEGTVLQPGEQKSAWLAFEVPRWLYPPASSTYPPPPPLAAYMPSTTRLPGQSFQTDLAALPWQLKIQWGGQARHVDLVEVERRAAIATRSVIGAPGVTVLEFGPRISGLSVGHVWEVYEEVWSRKAYCVVLFDGPCLLVDDLAKSRLRAAELLSGWQQVHSAWVNIPNTVATSGGTFVGSTDELLSGGGLQTANSETEAVEQVLAASSSGQPMRPTNRRYAQDPRRTTIANLRGGLDDPKVIDTLSEAIVDSDSSIATAAFGVITGRLTGDVRGDRLESLRRRKPAALEGKLLDAVYAAANSETSIVRYHAIRTLKYCQDTRANALVLEAFKDLEPSVRTAAAEAAVTRPVEEVESLLLKQLDDTHEHTALAACQALAQFEIEACVPRLKELQTSKNSFVANSATDALRELGVLTEVEAVTFQLDRGLNSFRGDGHQVLLATKNSSIIAKLVKMARNGPSDYAEERVACLLAEMGQPEALDLLLERVVPGDRINPSVPLALAKLGDPRAIAPLKKALTRSYGTTRIAIIEALLTFDAPGILDQVMKEIEQDPEGEQTGMLLWALRRAKADAALQAIEPFLNNERWHDAAAAILWDLGTPSALAALEGKLSAAEYPYGVTAVQWAVESAAQIARRK